MLYPDFRTKPENMRVSRTIISRATPDPEFQIEHIRKVPAFKLTQSVIRKPVEKIIGLPC